MDSAEEMKATLNALANENETNEQQQQDCVLRNETLRELQQNNKDVSTIKQLIESNNRPDTTAMSFEIQQ